MDKLLQWAVEIQSLSQIGLTYTTNAFDIERYERLREISAEMLAEKTGLEITVVKDLFCNETGYQTPKLDTRAVVFQNGKLLLTQEKNGTWSLPGGWCDVIESIRSNTVKEVKEETGLDVEAVRIIALQDRNKHNKPIYAYGICKVFVLCRLIGGEFTANIETAGIDYFALDDIPHPLAEEKPTWNKSKCVFPPYRMKTGKYSLIEPHNNKPPGGHPPGVPFSLTSWPPHGT